MKTEEKQTNSLSYKELFQLMDLCLQEWIHRDLVLWKQVITYFWAALIVIVLPYTALLSETFPLPVWCFSIIGFVLTVAFCWISLSHCARLRASGITYGKYLALLPPELQRVKIRELAEYKYKDRLQKKWEVYQKKDGTLSEEEYIALLKEKKSERLYLAILQKTNRAYEFPLSFGVVIVMTFSLLLLNGLLIAVRFIA